MPRAMAATVPAGAPLGAAAVDPSSGFCSATGAFVSLRPAVPLPPDDTPLSYTHFAFSLLPDTPPSRPALVDATTGAAVSYPDLLLSVNALAAAIQHTLGVAKGDVAFVLAPTRLDIPVLYLALLSIGAVVSPANPVLTASEISHLVHISRPSIAFTTSAMVDKLTHGLAAVFLDSPQFLSMMSPGDHDRVGCVPYAVWPADPAAIHYSSGTSGRMKAAVISHRSLIAQTAGFHARQPATARAHTTLVVAPMFHTLGFIFSLNGIALGETTVLITPRQKGATTPHGGATTPAAVLWAAERHLVTQMLVAPPLVVSIAKADVTSAQRSMKTVEVVISGGAPLPVPAAAEFRARFPLVDLCLGYGSTEAGGISLMVRSDEYAHLGSSGRLCQNVEVRVVDTIGGKILSVGQVGEFHVYGPSIMTAYLRDEEANRSVFTSDGWLKTGDLGYIDKGGFLFVVDRLKELIKYKGYQIPPAELEQLLQSMPGVVDVAVAPYPDEYAGQIPMALIVREPGSSISESAVIEYVAKQVAPYKKIRKAVFVNAIPKSPSGKILRRQLSDIVSSGFVSKL